MLEILLGVTCGDTCSDELARVRLKIAQTAESIAKPDGSCADSLPQNIEALDSLPRFYVRMLPECSILYNGSLTTN